MCVCLGLSEDGAFFLFASSRVFSVPRTSQNIESVFKCNGRLDEKCKYLPGSSLEKMKDLHSDVFSKDNWGLLVAFLNADQLGLRRGMEAIITFPPAHPHPDSRVAIYTKRSEIIRF